MKRKIIYGLLALIILAITKTLLQNAIGVEVNGTVLQLGLHSTVSALAWTAVAGYGFWVSGWLRL